MLQRSTFGMALLALVTCLSITSVAHQALGQPQPTQPKVNEASLVPRSDLERHALPATQRSLLNVAVRQDTLPYLSSGEDTSPFFVGFGGPLLSYKNMRWRTFTLWMFDDGFQWESALGASIYQHSSSAWYVPNEYVIGAHIGVQELPTEDSYTYTSFRPAYDDPFDDPYAYDDYGSGYYTRVEPLYYGLQVAAYYSRMWIELSFDLSEVFQEDYNTYDSTTELRLTRVGLSLGFGFL